MDTANGGYHKRLDRRTGKALPEANWVWSPQLAVNMHMPEMWGVVEFTGAPARRTPTAPVTAGDRARWTLRRVYYAERDYHGRNGRYAADLGTLGDAPRGRRDAGDDCRRL